MTFSRAMSPVMYTTQEAAAKAGISRVTLQAWIKAGKITPPNPTLDGARSKRLWTALDISRLRATKERIYRRGKGRGRQPKLKK
jgi:predicted site-specific integrase-resolvase